MSLSNQEIFDTVSKHLLAQNRKCKDSKGRYRYHYKQLRCAVGFLINQEYEEQVHRNGQGLPVSEYPVLDALKKSGVITDHDMRNAARHTASTRYTLLESLQDLHDYYHPNQWKKELSVIANMYDLQPTHQGT